MHLHAGEGLLEGAGLAAAGEETHEVVPAHIRVVTVSFSETEVCGLRGLIECKTGICSATFSPIPQQGSQWHMPDAPVRSWHAT